MSIRYSGDAEIRLGYDPKRRAYRGSVVDPYLRFPASGQFTVPASHVLRDGSARDPSSPEAYDAAARRLAAAAQRWAKSERLSFLIESDKRGRVLIRRVFQSPCPLEDL